MAVVSVVTGPGTLGEAVILLATRDVATETMTGLVLTPGESVAPLIPATAEATAAIGMASVDATAESVVAEAFPVASTVVVVEATAVFAVVVDVHRWLPQNLGPS